MIANFIVNLSFLKDDGRIHLKQCEITMRTLFRAATALGRGGGRLATLLLRYPGIMSKKRKQKLSQVVDAYKKKVKVSKIRSDSSISSSSSRNALRNWPSPDRLTQMNQ
jgi:hypothetical protein